MARLSLSLSIEQNCRLTRKPVAMKPYAWSCFACEATNPPDAARCERCGCPAQATRAQIENARSQWRQRSGLPVVERFDFVAEVMTLPLLLIASAALGLLGGLALIVSTNASFTAFGALVLALAALCLSSYRAPQPA
jgi:ribosomal protein L40E